MWANVQVGAERPFELDFNLSDAKCWKPFFGPRGYPPPRVIEPLSMVPLVFKRMSEEFRGDLEREVEDHLQREFEDLRAHRPTDWNHSLSNTLKKLLKRFEEDAIGLSPLTREEHDAQLDKFRTTYNLVGFPIQENLAEGGSLAPLVEKMKLTNIWLSDGPKIQFSLAAYVHAYPNNIASVWIYVAALHDARAPTTGGGE